jgi:hypothetical protein
MAAAASTAALAGHRAGVWRVGGVLVMAVSFSLRGGLVLARAWMRGERPVPGRLC